MTPTEQIAAWLRERREIAGKATQGEWRSTDYHDLQEGPAVDTPCGEYVCATATDGDLGPKDAAHIADAHNHQPRLIAALERAVSALEEHVLGHIHGPEEQHIRRMGETYGWCFWCHTKVPFGKDAATEALDDIAKILKGEES